MSNMDDVCLTAHSVKLLTFEVLLLGHAFSHELFTFTFT